MRLVVTGGGTGGHVYPALEVARLAGARGAELLYLGSLRGQEGRLCEERGILFKGFPSEPLYSMKSPRGWRSLAKLLRSRGMAKTHMAAAKPDVVFSTGGYSAGPVLAAARSLDIPYVIHDGNSVPGRANKLFGKEAKSFLTVFHATERLYRDRPVVRTGQPVRRELRDAVLRRTSAQKSGPPLLLVLGGSQGSAYLNQAVPNAVGSLTTAARVLHSAGPAHVAKTLEVVRALNLKDYEVQPFLQADQMADAYCEADLVVCRSGTTLAELAMFGIPSVLVPLPTSAEDHQRYNALEFAAMKGALIADQEPEPFTATAQAIRSWLSDSQGREEASRRLKEWDVPDATERIVSHIEAAVR